MPVTPHPAPLPWPEGVTPLMLAPMQGLTNRSLRALFIEKVRPDVVFTEFMRVNPQAAKHHLAAVDLMEIAPAEGGVPLVVQLIGHGREALVSAARSAEAAGAVHLNLNLGCPYGRMTSGLTGGGTLKRPEILEDIIPALRQAISGTFSVKLRAGYDNPAQIYGLLPLFEAAGVDFIILHPRTVLQAYAGAADHSITAEVATRTRLPVIANGDIRTAADGERVLKMTGAAGLMLGRGAIADPLLFQRLRGMANPAPEVGERRAELHSYLTSLLASYQKLFCGETQVLNKIKGVITTMDDPALAASRKKLLKSRTISAFTTYLSELE